MPRQHYDIFKHKVRTKLPKKIRYATVCRRCKKQSIVSERCFTCRIDEALLWKKPY